MTVSWGIRSRAIFLAVAPAILIALALTIYFVVLRYDDVEKELYGQGQTMARQLAPAAEFGAFSGNRTELQRLLQAAGQETGVVAISIHDAAGHLLATTGTPTFTGDVTRLTDGRVVGAAVSGKAVEVFHAKIRRPVLAFDDPFFAEGYRGETRDAILGSVTLELSRAALEQRQHEILLVALAATVLALALGGLLAYRLGRDVTEPILALEAAVEHLRAGDLEARVARHPSGTLVKLEVGINEMAAALAAAQRRSADALADSEAELARQLRFAQTVLNAQSDAGVGLAIVEHGKIIYANRAMEQIFGYANSELTALPSFIHLVHPDDRARMMYNYLRRIEGETFEHHYDFTLRRKNGEKGFADITVATLPVGDRVQTLCFIVDITERKWAEARLATAHQELLQKTEETERASQAKSRFLAAASHDLRQPLHALTLFAGELEATAESPSQRKLVGHINTAVGAMAELLDALLDVSRLDTADIVPQRQPTALGPLLESVAEGHRQSARAKGLRLRCRATDAWADTDPHLLRRMVSNLVANAVRYTKEGGILIGVRRRGKRWRIEVWDTGIGIAEHHLPQVFQEFYQVANPERDATKGLGLGLSIVQRLGQVLGHPVRVRSAPQQGSVFAIELPVAQPQAVTEHLPLLQQPQAQIVVLSPGGEANDSVCEMLKAWGYMPRSIATTDKLKLALRLLPDLIIVEENCADVMAATLATNDGKHHAPLLFLGEPSAHVPFTADAVLPKPVRPARLRALLHHLLDERSEGGAVTP